MLFPILIVISVPAFATGILFTVTVEEAVSVQLPMETITEYVVEEGGETVMEELVELFVHE